MLSFKIHLLESCIATIQDAFAAKQFPRFADIMLSASLEKIGNLEMIFDDSADPGNGGLQKFFAKKKSAPKRQMQSNSLVPPRKSKMVEPIQACDNVISTKVSPEALVNVTQNLTTGEKNFQCSLCGYVSNQKSAVKRHIELKHLPKTVVFNCQLCEYTASLRFHLKSHYTGKHNLPAQAAKAMLATD